MPSASGIQHRAMQSLPVYVKQAHSQATAKI